MTDGHLVDTVSECVRNPANYGPPDFTGGHLAQLDRSRLAVEGGVGGHYQVGRVFQRGVACRDQRSVYIVQLSLLVLLIIIYIS